MKGGRLSALFHSYLCGRIAAEWLIIMKTNKSGAIVRIVLWSLTAVILLGLLLWCLGLFPGLQIEGISFGNWALHYDESNQYQIGSGSVPAENLNALEINWGDGTVDLVLTDGNSVVFQENEGLDEDEQLRYRVVGGRLIIQYCKSQWGIGLFGFRTPKKNLTLEIPRSLAGQLTDLEIDVTSASVTGQELTARNCRLNSVSGSILLERCSFDFLEMDTVSGGLTLSGQANRLELDGVSADMTLSLSQVPGEISSDTVSGHVQITLPADASFSAELDSVSGKLDCQFSTSKQGDVYYCGQGGGAFSFDSVSGNVRIQKAA